MFSLGLGVVIRGQLAGPPAPDRPRRNRPRPAGDGRDERFARIDLRAIAVSGLVLITVLIAAWLVEIARGHSGSPYYWLAAIGGLSYVLAVAFFRWSG